MSITVNGTNIENSVIEKEIERLRPDYEKSVPAQKPEMARFHLLDQAKKNLIDRVLISQASKDQGPDVSAKKLEEVYSGIIKQNGGEKKFLEKYKLKIEDIPGVKNDLEHQLKHEGLINSVTEDSEVSLDEAKDILINGYDEIYNCDPKDAWGNVGKHCRFCDYKKVCPFYKKG